MVNFIAQNSKTNAQAAIFAAFFYFILKVCKAKFTTVLDIHKLQYQAPLEKKICLSDNQNYTVIKIIEHGGKAISESRTQSQNNLVNERIRSKEVRLIDENGENLGVIETAKALQMAYDKDLDLVVISPNQDPPVAKILNYGKYKFEAEKKAKEAKKNQKIVSVKEIRLTPVISIGDFETKLKAGIKFLQGGDKLKVTLTFNRRARMLNTNPDFSMLTKYIDSVSEYANVERQPVLEGKNISATLAPKKK